MKRWHDGKWILLITLVLGAVMSFGCPKNLEHTEIDPECEPLPLPAGSLGSWDNPVRCDMPAGELAYLERLRGPDRKPVRYRRSGNLGPGVNGHIVDRYVVQSEDFSVCAEVIMDMYYPGYVENKAVEGFYLVDQMF